MTDTGGSGSSKTDNRSRAQRITPDRPWVVKSRTLGVELDFAMQAENVSRSGLLLSWTHKRHLPYNINTLLELQIQEGVALGGDRATTTDTQAVRCLAKVVRRKKADGAGDVEELGVKIVQIDTHDHRRWDAWMARLEAIGDAEDTPALPSAS